MAKIARKRVKKTTPMSDKAGTQLGDVRDALVALRNGDFIVRLPAAGGNTMGALVAAFNDLADRLAAFSDRIDRAAKESGVEGQGEGQAFSGAWADMGNGVRAVIEKHDTLAAELARVTAEAGSERQRAEQALHERRRHLHLVISSMPNMLLLVQADHCLSAFMAPPGFPPILKTAVVSPHESLDDVLPAEIAGEMKDALVEARRCGKTRIFQADLDVDGQTKYFEVKVSPIQDSGEMLVVINDVTSQRQEQLALNRMKDEFVASVSHELRTPLNSIRGFLKLLLQGKVDDPEIQQEFLTRIATSADRLLNMVNGLLDVTQIEAGCLALEMSAVDVKEVITSTVKSLQSLADDKDITLTCDLPDGPLTAWADQCRVQQVLTNLVGNAIKFSEPGGPVRITAEAAEREVVVRVIDRGPGVPPDDLPRLFDKYFQSESDAKRAGKGAGLGLYISKEIVEALGGQIGVESIWSEGSTFFFTLPVPGQDE